MWMKWGSESRTSQVFKWWKQVRFMNGQIFECHSQLDHIVQFFKKLHDLYFGYHHPK